jgi:two-component system phosphate regulon sensor histidine kinase PhoR
MLGKKNFASIFLFFFFVLWGLFSLTSWKESNFLRVSYLHTETKTLKADIELLKPHIQKDLSEGNIARLNDAAQKVKSALSTELAVLNENLQPLNEINPLFFNPSKNWIKSNITEAQLNPSGILFNENSAMQSGLLCAIFPLTTDKGKKFTGIAIKQLNPKFAENNYFAQAFLAVFISIILSCFTLWIIEKSLKKPAEEIEFAALKIADKKAEILKPIIKDSWAREMTRILNLAFENYRKQLDEAKSDKEELESIFLSMPHGAVAIDMNGIIITANKAAVELLNLRLDPVGRSIQESTRNTGLQNFAEKLLKQKEPLESEFAFYGTEEERFLQANGTVLRNSDSEIIGMLIILSDITRIKRLESLRRDFVANVSHEIKTPITAIRGSVETLQEGAMDDPEESGKFMKIITRHSDRLIALVDDLLSLSSVERTSSEGKDYDFTPYDVKNLANNVIDLCQAKAEEKNIELALDCETGITAEMAVQQMEQALLNLVDNAIKYTNENGKVEIKARLEEENVEIKVKDSGCGIAKEHIPRLFERFYRVDKARSRKLGGTGLGLAIVKHIVQAHKGKIRVESKPGEGSEFILNIPKKRK